MVHGLAPFPGDGGGTGGHYVGRTRRVGPVARQPPHVTKQYGAPTSMRIAAVYGP